MLGWTFNFWQWYWIYFTLIADQPSIRDCESSSWNLPQWVSSGPPHAWRRCGPWWSASGCDLKASDHVALRTKSDFWSGFSHLATAYSAQLSSPCAPSTQRATIFRSSHACISPLPSSPPTLLELTCRSCLWAGDWWTLAGNFCPTLLSTLKFGTASVYGHWCSRHSKIPKQPVVDGMVGHLSTGHMGNLERRERIGADVIVVPKLQNGQLSTAACWVDNGTA